MTTEPDFLDDLDPEKIKEYVKNLPPEERQALLEEVEAEDLYPVINWAPNPLSIKATLNFISDNGTVTYEELRQHLVDLGYADTEEGEYNFGVVSIEDDDSIFETDGGRDADTNISLTQIGEDIASVFDDRDDALRPHERALLFGLQPYGSGITYLALLEENRSDGILRQDLEDAMTDQYGGKGKYFTGYFTSFYARLGLIEKEQVGRKKKFHPDFPEAW